MKKLSMIILLTSICIESVLATQFSFKNPQLESGSSKRIGAVYRFPDVATGIDALVKITAFNNGANIVNIDKNDLGLKDAFQPTLHTSLYNSDSSVDFEITFVESGTNRPKEVSFNATGADIDGNGGSVKEYISLTKPDSYTLENPTRLAVSENGFGLYAIPETTANVKGITVTETRNIVTARYKNISTIHYRIGATNGWGQSRYNSLYFKDVTYDTPQESQVGPVAEYRFDKCAWSGAQGEVVDHVGEHNATAINGASTERDAKIKRAAHFDGDNYIDTGDSFNDIFGNQNDKFTITAWIKPEALTDEHSNHGTKNTFMAKASDKYNDNIEIGVNPDGTLHLYLDTKNRDAYANIGSGITKDQWHFVAVSYDGNEVRVKIDDRLYTNTTTWSGGGNMDQAVGSPLTIGATLHRDNFFQGNVDEVKIFDRVLSDDTLAALYEKEKADDGSGRESQACLMGEYRFDACEWFEPNGKIKDSVGGFDATAGDASPSAEAIIGTSARIVETAVEATPDYTFQNHPFTLSFWMKLEKMPTKPDMAIMRKEFELYVKSDGQINLNPKNGENDIESVQKVAAGEWHYVTISSDGQSVTLYIDGKSQGSADAKDLGKNGTTTLELGETDWDDAEKFDGYIDELKIFDGMLTATEIKALIDLDNNGTKNYDGSDRTALVCLDPIGCSDKAIVIDDTKYVHQIDLATGDKNTTVMTTTQINGTSVNGFGYNVTDGFLWGSAIHAKGGYLVKIGKDANGEFAQKQVGPIEGLPTDKRGTYVGDIDNNGRLYLYYPGSGKMYVINLNKDLPDYLKVIDTYTIKSLAIADMAFNPQDNQLYAIENDNDLYRIDVQNHSVTLIKPHAVDEETDTFGSSFFDAQGFFYAIKNTSRNVYRIDLSDPDKIRSLIFSTLRNDQVQHVNIDGGRCNLKPIYVDYGDAPDGSNYSKGDSTGTLNYRTLTSDEGARHRLPSDENQTNVYLGSGVSAESDAKSSNSDYNYDDDDGIVGGIKRLYTNMYTYDLKLEVNNDTNRTAHLSGWIDFNRNGRFETKEGVGADIASQSHQIVTLHWNVPDDIAPGETYARFRVTTDEMGIEEHDSHGAKSDGEVEDWQITIKEGSLYDAWDTDSDLQHRVIKTKLVNEPFSLSVASVDRNGHLKESTGSDIKARIISKDDGTALTEYQDVNLSTSDMIALHFPAIDKPTREATVQLRYKDERNITREVNATDLFAIRPDHFTMEFTPSTLTAAEDFNLTVKAVDQNGTDLANFQLPKESYLLDVNETKTTQACGDPIAPTKKEKRDFKNGDANITVNYPDIGNLKFWLREKPGSEFARVDANDTPDNSGMFIKAVTKEHAVDPAKIKLTWKLENGDAVNDVTYFNSYDPNDPEAAKMRAKLDLNLTVLNKNGESVKKFTKGCYARDVDIGLKMKIESADAGSYKLLASYQDRNDTYLTSTSKLPETLGQGEQSVDGFKIESALFNDGDAVKKVKFNFQRDASKPFNPMRLHVTDINASLDAKSDADTSDKNIRFFYTRAHVPDQKIVGKEGDAKVYYEVYCKGCDQSAFGLENLPESVDSINWYILKSISESEFFDFEDPAVTNHATLSQPGTVSAYHSIFSAITKPAGNSLLHMEVNKSPETVRVKYKPKSYLVFNPFNAAATTHSFTANFYPRAKSWAGKGDTGYTVDTNIAPRNNMDIIDW